MAPLAMTRHHSRSPLPPRDSGPAILSKIALITGAVVGFVVIIISLCAWIVRHGRLRKLKKEVDEDLRKEEEHRQITETIYRRDALLAEQKPIWEADFHEKDVPYKMLTAYKHEFFSLPPEDREALIPVSLRRKWDDAATMDPEDSVSFILENGLDRKTKEGCRRFVMERWWEDHGRHAVLAQLDSREGSSRLQRDNIGLHANPMSTTRLPKYLDDVEAGYGPSRLQRDNFSHRSNPMSPTRYPKYVDDMDLGEGSSGLQRDIYSAHSTPTSPQWGQRYGEDMKLGERPLGSQHNNFSSLRSNPTSPTRYRKHGEDLELGPRKPPYSYQSPPPPTHSLRSNPRTLVPQLGLNSSIGRVPSIQVYSPEHELQDRDDRYITHGIDSTKRSGLLEAPENTRSRKGISMTPSDFTMVSEWDMPAEYKHIYYNRQSTFTEAETVLSNDGYRGDAERNRAERRRMQQREEREEEAREHEEELGNDGMKKRLEMAKKDG